MGPLAYYFSTFPALTTSFVQHQVRATEKLGWEVVLAANTRPLPGAYDPRDEDLKHRTFYLTPVRPAPYLRETLRALRKTPRPYMRALGLALQLNRGSLRQLGRNLAHLGGAPVLAAYLERSGVRHVHVHFAYGAAELAIFLEALCGIPYSLSLHGSDVLFPNPLAEEILRRARFLVSNCQYHIDHLRTRFPSLKEQRFFIVRGGLDVQAPPWTLSGPAPGPPPLRLLNVARLHPVKAQNLLIRACAGLRDAGIDFECRIIGDGPLGPELERLISRLGLGGRVRLLGALYEKAVVEMYEWAHVVVLSSRSEGTPMTVIEAMAKGRPVVAPGITALPEMILPGTCGMLFEPGCLEDLARCLGLFASDPARIAAMGLEARKRAEELFCLEENVKRLAEIFAAEVPRSRSPRRAPCAP